MSSHPNVNSSIIERRTTIGTLPAFTPATLNNVFEYAETEWATKSGLTFGDKILSFGRLCSMARAISQLLAEHGVKPGDRIAILSRDSLECLTTFWGVTLLGAIFVPLNPASGHANLSYIIEQCAPVLLFYGGLEKNRINSLCLPPNLNKVFAAGAFLHELSAEESSLQWTAFLSSPDTPAVILYTSGSTGHPKGVILSHAALCRSGEAMASHYQWGSDDRFLNLAEFHTMSGLRNSAIVPFISGALVVQTRTDERESFFKIIESIKSSRATLLGAAPIFVKQLSLFMGRINADQMKSLRAILCTGSALDPILVEQIYQYLHLPVVNYYGLTETAGFCAGYSLSSFFGRKGGIGFPVGSSLTVQNERGEIQPCETLGELVINSTNLMLGYYKEKDLTDASLKNGQFYTGDIGKITKEGEVILVGRKKNFIKNAHTELVYFEEVEMALEQHPQVNEAAVCGTVNRLGCEELVAFIVPNATITSTDDFVSRLKVFLQERIGRHKVPQTAFIVERLPRHSTGKLSRQGIERMLHDV